MKKWMLFSAVAALFVTAQSSAQAGFVVRARLTSFEEVPAISTAARGEFVARVSGDRIVYRLNFSDLSTTSLFAHIHFGAEKTNGGIAAFLCGGSGKAACPERSGEFSGIIVPADVVGPGGQGIAPGDFAEVARAIRNGFAYANVHSQTFPSGEIRGQIRHDAADN